MVNFPMISVLGCGWFGFPMAIRLVQQGYSVKGSTTSQKKLRTLTEYQIEANLVQFPLNDDHNLSDFFDCDILLLNIPPKGKPKEFLENIKQIISLAQNSKLEHILFISSTSVYGDTNSPLTELDTPAPETASGKTILEAEQLLSSQTQFTTTIIRFAGLVGPGRHPGRFFNGKTDIANGLAPINLIHLEDCVGVIEEIIERKAFGYTYNACSPKHPTRKEFYTLATKALSLELPIFIDEKLSWKIIDSVNVPKLLGYGFKVDDWSEWLKATVK